MAVNSIKKVQKNAQKLQSKYNKTQKIRIKNE